MTHENKHSAREAVYFVVQNTGGKTSSALYYGGLPGWVTGKHAHARGVVYAVRLDTLEEAPRLLAFSRDDLEWLYLKGGMPPSNLAAPKAASGGSKRRWGEWWKPPAPSWDPKAPGEPHPQPDQVKAKLDAPARQREVIE
jgi:hypothetical protein